MPAINMIVYCVIVSLMAALHVFFIDRAWGLYLMLLADIFIQNVMVYFLSCIGIARTILYCLNYRYAFATVKHRNNSLK